MSETIVNGHLKKGNREVITDYYVPQNIEDEQNNLKFKIFVRLTAKEKTTFRNVSFLHCIFDNCYFKECVFDSCDFTGCNFLKSNFHNTKFSGCKFWYATFERCQIDVNTLISEAPKEENLKIRFARSLRTNYQQNGDADAVNKAISVELEATSKHLYKSWKSKETYYKTKYNGFLKKTIQFVKWINFWIFHLIWGNGESIMKLAGTIAITLFSISIYDTWTNGKPLSASEYWLSVINAPSFFLGVSIPDNFSTSALSIITGIRLISIALLTALLVRRLSKR